MGRSRSHNPFRPGAGHPPPYLAGREPEKAEFARLLDQDRILENPILTGLRGVGKTVLLDTLKPAAIAQGWLWVGTDMSESTSVQEETIALRLLTDLAIITSEITVSRAEVRRIGFARRSKGEKRRLTFDLLGELFDRTPGLTSDKLKSVLETVWQCLRPHHERGVIFAYDEAQTLCDHAATGQYPLSTLLDVFQSLQKKGIPFMLVLAGLPTLFPKLVAARTYSERMFRVMFLDRLGEADSRAAILKPLEDAESPVELDGSTIQTIVELSGGYPYFIQYICKEVFDALLQRAGDGKPGTLPVAEITRKLDTDFFAGRWARVTDRQRELMTVVASLDSCDDEFAVQEIVARSKATLAKPFSASHVSQLLAALAGAGLIYKNRHGRYSFAVPLLWQFIRRQQKTS